MLRITKRHSTWKKKPKLSILTKWISKRQLRTSTRELKLKNNKLKLLKLHRKIDQLSKLVVIKPTSQIGKMARVTYSMRKNLNIQFTHYPSEEQAATNKLSQVTKFRAYSDKQNEFRVIIKNLCKSKDFLIFYRIATFEPAGFGFETTNNIAYQDFKFQQPQKPSLIKPVVYPVTTKAPPTHFTSTTKQEMKYH